MKIGLAIYNVLTNDTDVSNLVSTRIFPNVAKQGTAFPFLVYQTTSVEPTNTKDGVSPMDTNSFEVLCFADNYSTAVDLAQKVRIALDRKNGTYPATTGIKIQSIKFNSVDEEFEIEGDGRGIYVQTLTFDLRQVDPVAN